MKRYLLVSTILLFVLSLSSCQRPIKISRHSDWYIYKHTYISSGRVIDTGNGDISHSEGQGYGMLLAESYGDKQSFARIWSWTRRHLQIRKDRLLAWRWSPNIGGVTDLNNATDGDILVAWALLRASNRWHIPQYKRDALEIIRDIKTELILKTPWGPILLPGRRGFIKRDGVEVNLSYWIYPALEDFAKAYPSPVWGELIKTGIRLLKHARFGRWHLPPDWLLLNHNIRPLHPNTARFGFNAVRIPLYLIWGGFKDRQLLKPFVTYYDYFQPGRFLPAWTRLSNNSVDSYNAPPGIYAIFKLTSYVYKESGETAKKAQDLFPPLTLPQNYYSASLLLMSKIAFQERVRP